jgi:hypothetical protein
MPVGDRKTGRLDNVGGRAQACAEAQNRSGVLGNVRLEKRNLHGRSACKVPMKMSQ